MKGKSVSLYFFVRLFNDGFIFSFSPYSSTLKNPALRERVAYVPKPYLRDFWMDQEMLKEMFVAVVYLDVHEPKTKHFCLKDGKHFVPLVSKLVPILPRAGYVT